MTQPRVLLLDDSGSFLAFLSALLEGAECTVLRATSVPVAVGLLAQGPNVALVDLFLEGDTGAELSNGFIKQYLIPARIPFGRVTSATHLLPDDLRGALVWDKTELRNEPVQFVREFLLTFGLVRINH